jgi:hypothetical protein
MRHHLTRRPKFELLEARLALALTVDIAPAVVLESAVATATVMRTGSLAAPLTVTLSSSDSAQATVPVSVIIPANLASITFDIAAVNDASLDAGASVVITASADGHGNAGALLQIVNDDAYGLRTGPASDILNLTPGAQPDEFNVTGGPLAALATGSPAYAAFGSNGVYQTGGESQSIQSNQFLPVDPGRTYALAGWAKSGDEFGERYLPTNRQSFGYASYDVDYQQILPQHVLRFAGAADTSLAAPLNPGDTVVHLASAAGWSNAAEAPAATRGIAWYGYQNSHGGTYADYTYTRNVALGGTGGLWNPGAVSGNVITLARPWIGPTLPAGTAIRNTGAGSDVVYNVLDSQSVPGDWTWTQYAAIFGGQVLQNGADAPTLFRPGTAYVKPALLANQQGGFANFVSWRDVTLTPVAPGTTPAQLALPLIDLSTITPGDQRQALPDPVGSQFGWSAALVKVNASESYTLSARAFNVSDGDDRPLGFDSLDVDKKVIHPLHVAKYGFAADTTLAAALSPGDTAFYITSASGWSNDVWEAAHTRSLAWYGYADSTGQTYENYTYTRNVAADFDDGLWDAGVIHYDAGLQAYRVTLRQAWAGPALAAGAAVRNAMGGEAYNQPPVAAIPQVGTGTTIWTDYAATFGGGVWQNGQPSDTAFRPGTVYIQPVFTKSVWTDVVIGPAQDAVYGGPADPTLRLLEAGTDRQIALNLDVLGKNAFGPFASVVIDSIAAPQFGTAALGPGVGPGGRAVIRYHSPAWFLGTDVVTYTLRNTLTNQTLTTSVTINVLGGNFGQSPALVAALTAQAAIPENHVPWVDTDGESYRVLSGQPLVIDVLSGPGLLATVIDGTDVNVVRLLSSPRHGALSVNPDGSFTYKSAPDYVGFDSFKYETFDGINATERTALISVANSTEGWSVQRLRDIGYAMANYENAKNSFPLVFSATMASNFDANGNPHLSWRVHILPYLGYQRLYSQFHLDEPWDSPNNLPLASMMPAVFRDVTAPADSNATRYQIISAEGAPYYWQRSTGGNLVGPTPNKITDGLQNTLLVVEVGADQANIWTKPDDLDFDPNNPLAALGAISREGINGVMADGSTITLLPTINAETFKSLVTIAGGESVDADALRRQFAASRGAASLQTFGANASIGYFGQIALAMLDHESAKGYYPVGRTDAQGMPLLSWRVYLLPYLGYTNLYNRFNRLEPWDSPTNLPLLAEMPDVFRSAADSARTTSTRIVTFFNNGATFRAYPFAPNADVRGMTEASIRDGVANTIMFFEAGAEAAEPWTKPGGVTFVKADPLATAGAFPAGIIRAMMFDRNAATLPFDIPAATIAALVTQAGSEMVDVATVTRRELQRRGFSDGSNGLLLNSDYYQQTYDFKNIALGMLNFESSTKYLPADTFNAAGTPLLSWRVHILPFIGYSHLYARFNRTQPWDSPTNLPLLAEMPDLFRAAGDPADSVTTRALGFTGLTAGFPATGINTTKGLQFKQITDGTSNTFAFALAGRDAAVPWTKPDDVPFHANNPFSALGDLGRNLIAAHFDGSVQGHLATMTREELIAYITRAGGEPNTPPAPSVPDFYIRESAGDTSTTEFGVDVFDVVLDKAPLTNVVLSLAVSGAGVATLDRQTLTFTPSNWNVSQRVALRGVDNHVANHDRTVDVTVAVVASLSDDAYDAVLPQSFVATVRDDLRQFSADFAADGRINGNDFLAWQRGLGATAGATNAQGDADNDGDVDRDDLTRWRAQVGLVNVVADFNASARIDGADFLAWQRGLGVAAGATRDQGDADGDGDVDAADLASWRFQFGVVVAAPAAVSLPSSEVASSELVAAAVVAQNDLEASSALDIASLAGASSLLTAGRTTAAAKLSRSISFESGAVRDHLFAQLDRVTRDVAPSGHGATKRGESSLPALADVEDDDQPWTDLADDCLRRELVVPRGRTIAE